MLNLNLVAARLRLMALEDDDEERFEVLWEQAEQLEQAADTPGQATFGVPVVQADAAIIE